VSQVERTFIQRWWAYVALALVVFWLGFGLCGIWWNGPRGEFQTIRDVTKPARFRFAKPGESINTLVVRVKGKIKGSATITVSERAALPIAGDVKLVSGGDYFKDEAWVEYAPVGVVESGELSVEVVMH
jgi:hypothetical protein